MPRTKCNSVTTLKRRCLFLTFSSSTSFCITTSSAFKSRPTSSCQILPSVSANCKEKQEEECHELISVGQLRSNIRIRRNSMKVACKLLLSAGLSLKSWGRTPITKTHLHCRIVELGDTVISFELPI